MDAIDKPSSPSSPPFFPTLSWWHCVDRTLADMQTSLRRNRVISRPNLRRLFARRWHEATRSYDPSLRGSIWTAGGLTGRIAVERAHRYLCAEHRKSLQMDSRTAPPTVLKIGGEPTDGEGDGGRPTIFPFQNPDPGDPPFRGFG